MNEKEKKELERLQALENRLKARQKQSNDIIKANYDRVTATLPKGTKDRITGAGYTVNGLINFLVLEFLKKLESEK